MLKRPATAKEYVYLVDQALDEVNDLKMSAEYDMDSLGSALKFIPELSNFLQELRDSMADGSYKFGDDDLPFMRIVEYEDDSILPFKYLFQVINETHKKGLDIDE